MATIQYLRLDAENDTVWNGQASLTDLYAVTQAILTRLNLFQGSWWEDLNLGLPMFQSILSNPGTQKSQDAINLLITAQIQGTPYVSGVENPTVSFNPSNRALTYSATAITAFGTVPITFSPGSQAQIGAQS
jgi:hypothetical protein